MHKGSLREGSRHQTYSRKSQGANWRSDYCLSLTEGNERLTHRPPRPRLDEMTAPRQIERAESMYPRLKSALEIVSRTLENRSCNVLTRSCHRVVVVRGRCGSKLERNGRDTGARLPGSTLVSPICHLGAFSGILTNV